ncbi:hypothetical protein DPMN_063223 [Dreissena polymorpha]|uniref:Folate receptor-like domain-containing protein n=1 Tax=Dreissena polymorpha TaxID=45954 RepID=A0A9D4CA40_DREPO|nr:hypothetical protein DPMN_063223 [Dreissena polymorpha]
MKILTLTLLIGIVSCTPQCRRGENPRTSPEPLRFCGNYTTLGCCSANTDRSLSRTLQDMERFLRNENPSLWRRCESYAKDFLCEMCSPFSYHIFRDNAQREKLFPGLCKGYCMKFLAECEPIVGYYMNGLDATNSEEFGRLRMLLRDRNLSGFCDAVAPHDGAYCYPEVLTNASVQSQLVDIQTNQVSDDNHQVMNFDNNSGQQNNPRAITNEDFGNMMRQNPPPQNIVPGRFGPRPGRFGPRFLGNEARVEERTRNPPNSPFRGPRPPPQAINLGVHDNAAGREQWTQNLRNGAFRGVRPSTQPNNPRVLDNEARREESIQNPLNGILRGSRPPPEPNDIRFLGIESNGVEWTPQSILIDPRPLTQSNDPRVSDNEANGAGWLQNPRNGRFRGPIPPFEPNNARGPNNAVSGPRPPAGPNDPRVLGIESRREEWIQNPQNGPVRGPRPPPEPSDPRVLGSESRRAEWMQNPLNGPVRGSRPLPEPNNPRLPDNADRREDLIQNPQNGLFRGEIPPTNPRGFGNEGDGRGLIQNPQNSPLRDPRPQSQINNPIVTGNDNFEERWNQNPQNVPFVDPIPPNPPNGALAGLPTQPTNPRVLSNEAVQTLNPPNGPLADSRPSTGPINHQVHDNDASRNPIQPTMLNNPGASQESSQQTLPNIQQNTAHNGHERGGLQELMQAALQNNDQDTALNEQDYGDYEEINEMK